MSQRIEGVKATSSALKSVPADSVTFDEMDEFSSEMIDLARERLSHSELRWERYLSTPSIPGYGIHAKFQESNQNQWLIRCEHCNEFTCLEDTFPDCIKYYPETGKSYRACHKCGQEIFPANGQWVPKYPDRDVSGYHISQLNSAYIDPGEILNLFNDPPN